MENNDLKNEIVNFRNITLDIIVCLQNNNFEELNDLFLERQNIIDKINKINYDKEEFKSICSQVDVINIDRTLGSLLSEKRLKAKDNIGKFLANKNASNAYKNRNSIRSFRYNKKI